MLGILRDLLPLMSRHDHPGINVAAIICSLACTFTPVHVEDVLLGASNMLVHGAWKVWYIVPPSRARIFEEWMQEQYGKDAAAQVRLGIHRPGVAAGSVIKLPPSWHHTVPVTYG